MKSFGFTASVLKDTNYAISHSDADWSAIRKGSFARFGDDITFYTVLETERFMFIKDFLIDEEGALIINDNTLNNLFPGDSIIISYKEFGLSAILDLISPGSGYKVGDILNVVGGELIPTSYEGVKKSASIYVSQVSANGGVERIEARDPGKYMIYPTGTTSVSGGNGHGASFSLDFKVLDERTIIEREISEINIGSVTKLKLQYPLHPLIKDGKLSVWKWKIKFSSVYTDDSKINVSYEILRDFTPNIGIPMVAKNSLNTERIYNEAAVIIDREIGELKRRLDALTSASSGK